MRKKVISRIKIGDNVIKGQRNVTQTIREHFIEHCKQENRPHITLPLIAFKKLSSQHALLLDEIPNDNEILGATKSCDPTKAPRYDGYNLRLLLKMWDIIGGGVLGFVKSFFQNDTFPTSINTTWVTKIPKKESVDSVEDFRPISMVSCVYKIVSKVLTRMLKYVMGLINFENHYGFIAGRGISNSLITATECNFLA